MPKLPRLIFPLLYLCVCAIAVAQAVEKTSEGPSLLEKAYELDLNPNTKRNIEAAAELYAAAAATGDGFAHLRLGYLFETGDGVPQDYELARRHYQAAVDGGLNEARVRLAICHLEGWGGPKDRPAFAREIRAGAEAGEVSAQRILASMYFTGIAVVENQAEGVKWLERAAEQGSAEAQLDLGKTLEDVQRRLIAQTNLELARNWYQQAAEQEYFSAMRAMARTFIVGAGRDKNWPEARRWLELASEGGDAEAPFILAICELLLPGVPNSTVESSRALLTTASLRGNPRASEMLQLELAGRPLPAAAQYVLETPFEERYMQNLTDNAIDGENLRPVPYRVVKPIYPQALSLSGVVGKVSLEFIVDTKGRVNQIKVVQSSHPLFAERAIEALREWRFHPAKVKGRLVKVRLKLPLEFELPQEEVHGIDDVFTNAIALAQALGSQAEADARDLRMAKPVTPLVLPPEVRPLLPQDAFCLLLLVLNEQGRPTRGHVLKCEPENIGPFLLSAALNHTFEARVLAGKPVPSSVVLPFLSGKYAPLDSRQN